MKYPLRGFTLFVFLAFSVFFKTELLSKAPKVVEDQIKISGSMTIAEPIGELVNKFSVSRNVSMTNFIDNQSSGRGIKELISGVVDVARSSRPLTRPEIESASKSGRPLRSYLIGYGAIALSVGNRFSLNIKSLSTKQIYDIYFNEKVSDWSQIQSDLNGPILPVIKFEEGGSGTLDVFKERIAGSNKANFRKSIVTLNSLNEVNEFLIANSNAIAVLNYANLTNSERAIDIDVNGVAVGCDQKLIRSGLYPLSRELYLITTSHARADVLEFIEYSISPFGQKVFQEQGFVPVQVLE